MAKTVEQIAKDLNLSVTTVRLVLSGKAEQYRISVKTQSRINEHVERFGYTLNHSARSLKLNKTETLGLIVPNISNVFFATLAEKLELRCRRSGYQLMISCTYNDVDYENKLVKALMARNVDGLFIVPSTLENQQHHLRQIQKPLGSSTGILALLTTRWLRVITRPGGMNWPATCWQREKRRSGSLWAIPHCPVLRTV